MASPRLKHWTNVVTLAVGKCRNYVVTYREYLSKMLYNVDTRNQGLISLLRLDLMLSMWWGLSPMSVLAVWGGIIPDNGISDVAWFCIKTVAKMSHHYQPEHNCWWVRVRKSVSGRSSKTTKHYLLFATSACNWSKWSLYTESFVQRARSWIVGIWTILVENIQSKWTMIEMSRLRALLDCLSVVIIL